MCDSNKNDFYGNEKESSLIRCPEYFEFIFKKANLNIVQKIKHPGFDDEFFPQWVYVLTPCNDDD